MSETPDNKHYNARLVSIQSQIWKLEDILLTLVAGALEEDEVVSFWEMVKEREESRLASIREIQERLN